MVDLRPGADFSGVASLSSAGGLICTHSHAAVLLVTITHNVGLRPVLGRRNRLFGVKTPIFTDDTSAWVSIL